jgi:excinuclease UvrABC ATPase subunit
MSDNIENAEFEEVNNSKENVQEYAIKNLGFIQDDEDEDGNSNIDDIKKLTDLSRQYHNTEISKDEAFFDSNTGEMLDRTKLPPLEQIKIAARSMGQTINEPKKNCKKCHGRGYTGFTLEGNIPVACSCIHEEYYKANPETKKPEHFPTLNRKAKRHYDKAMAKYITQLAKTQVQKTKIIENSKANLRKNTKEENVNES